MILQEQRLENTISESHPLFIILPNGRLFVIKNGKYMLRITAESSPMDALYSDPSPFLEMAPPEIHTGLHILSESMEYVEKGGMKKYKQWKEKERRMKLKGGTFQ